MTAQAFAAFLKTKIETDRLSKAAVAAKLGVSRQMVYDYLEAKSAPGLEVVLAAHANLGMDLQLEAQLLLPGFIEGLTQQSLDVVILRKGADRVELGVTIRFGT